MAAAEPGIEHLVLADAAAETKRGPQAVIRSALTPGPLGVLALLAALLLAAPPAQAASAGDLDRTFSNDGKVTYDVFGGVDDEVNDVAVQSDGKIVVAGSWCGFAAGCATRTFALARFHADGSPDASFGVNGRTLIAFPHGESRANGVAIQSDGRIVAAGWHDDNDGVDDANFALVRLNPDGELDPSFGDGGRQTTSFGGAEYASAVALQTNAFPGDHRLRIVVVGSSRRGDDEDFALARYHMDGSLDPSFNGDGKVTYHFRGDQEGAIGVAVQPDGAIVTAGDTDDGDCPFSCDYDWALARHHGDGSLDLSSFGFLGKVVDGLGGSDDFARDVAIDDDGRIVAAGSTNDAGDRDIVVVRYLPDGSRDSSFGSGGEVRTSFDSGGEANEGASAIAIQADGKIVVAGGTDVAGHSDFALARYRSTGTLDASFADDGLRHADFGVASREWAQAIAIQVDGKIVAAGSTDAGSDGDRNFAIARFHTVTDRVSPKTTITDGPIVTTDRTPTFRFRSSEPRSTFQCRVDNEGFAPCDSPHMLETLELGPHAFTVRAIDDHANFDRTPARHEFVVVAPGSPTDPGDEGPNPPGGEGAPHDTSVELDIGGGRVGKRKIVLRLGCPAAEESPPCAGTVKARTRKAVRFRGRRHRVVLAERRFTIDAGATRRVRLRLSRRKARLLRASRGARRVQAIATVADAAGNEARVQKGLRLRLRRP